MSDYHTVTLGRYLDECDAEAVAEHHAERAERIRLARRRADRRWMQTGHRPAAKRARAASLAALRARTAARLASEPADLPF